MDTNKLNEIAVRTGLVGVFLGKGGAFVALAVKGKSLGLYPVMVKIAEEFTAMGVPSTSGGCCPNWGWVRVTCALGSSGEYYINVRSV